MPSRLLDGRADDRIDVRHHPRCPSVRRYVETNRPKMGHKTDPPSRRRPRVLRDCQAFWAGVKKGCDRPGPSHDVNEFHRGPRVFQYSNLLMQLRMNASCITN
jgi:hypothetical protein